MRDKYKDLDKLRALRFYLDKALSVCDPVTYAMNMQDLLLAIAEHLIEPLQDHELAELSKFPGEGQATWEQAIEDKDESN